MGTGIGHKALYPVHTPDYNRAREFEVEKNYETTMLKKGWKQPDHSSISKVLHKEKLPSWSDESHNNSSIKDGWKQPDHQSTSKG